MKNFDKYISGLHHIQVDFDGWCYSVIFGKYINGEFFSIPEWNVGGNLGSFNDIFYNTERIYEVLRNKRAARFIAESIRDYIQQSEEI